MLVKGLEDYMLPCASKKLFGMECFGCGLQRATAFLFKGEFIAAFKMYPAVYPLMALILFLVLNLFIKFRHAERIKVVLVVTSISTIIISFIIKQFIH